MMKPKTPAQQLPLFGVNRMVYENSHYRIEVGVPPKTPDFPEPPMAYLIFNKETEVLEYFHSVLYYAKQWADQFRDLLDGKTPPTADFGDSDKSAFTFN